MEKEANLKAKISKKHHFSVYTNQNKNWKPSIHDAILMMAISWNEISAETIKNCWIKSHLIIGTKIEDIIPDSLNDEFFRKNQINVDSLLNFDEDCIPNEPITVDTLLQIIENNKNEEEKSESSEENNIESQNISQ